MEKKMRIIKTYPKNSDIHMGGRLKDLNRKKGMSIQCSPKKAAISILIRPTI